jgi:hypothetical protein
VVASYLGENAATIDRSAAVAAFSGNGSGNGSASKRATNGAKRAPKKKAAGARR